MQNVTVRAALPLLACLACLALTVQAEECKTDGAECKDKDEVSLLQTSLSPDLQTKKINAHSSLETDIPYPPINAENTHAGDRLPRLTHVATLISGESEKQEQSLGVHEMYYRRAGTSWAAESQNMIRHGSVFSGIVAGILNSAREKIDALSVFLAHETEALTIKWNKKDGKDDKPEGKDDKVDVPIITPAQRLDKKGQEVVDYLTDAIKFLMTLLISVLILAFLVLCVVGCVLLINWRIQVVEEEERQQRSVLGEDDAAIHAPESNVRSTAPIVHRPFQGQARRLAPDSESEKSAKEDK